MSKQYYFHIGYPKTGSTTLQDNVFNNHSEIEYMSRVSDKSQQRGIQLDQRLYNFYDKLCAEYEYSTYKQDFNDLFSDLMSNSSKTTIIFSEEHCTAEKIPFEIIADRIKELKINFKILIVLRNQIDLLRSYYDMHPFHKDTKHLTIKTVSFDEWYQRIDKSSNRSLLNSLDYYSVANYYADIFGKKNIKIIKFEDLVKNKGVFSNDLSDFLCVNKEEFIQLLNNNSKNDFKLHSTAKWKNKYFANMHLSKILPKKIHAVLIKVVSKIIPHKKTIISKTSRKSIIERFAKSNKLLDQEYNLNLKDYNYPF